MPWAVIASAAAALSANSAAHAATLEAARRQAGKPATPSRADPYPLCAPKSPTYWDGFAPLVVPLFYALMIAAALGAAVWLVGAYLPAMLGAA